MPCLPSINSRFPSSSSYVRRPLSILSFLLVCNPSLIASPVCIRSVSSFALEIEINGEATHKDGPAPLAVIAHSLPPPFEPTQIVCRQSEQTNFFFLCLCGQEEIAPFSFRRRRASFSHYGYFVARMSEAANGFVHRRGEPQRYLLSRTVLSERKKMGKASSSRNDSHVSGLFRRGGTIFSSPFRYSRAWEKPVSTTTAPEWQPDLFDHRGTTTNPTRHA